MLSRNSISSIRVAGELALVAAVLAGTIGAQSSRSGLDQRWAPWLGCWQADNAPASGEASQSVLTCVTPLSGSSGVLALTVSHGRVTEHRRLVADGRPASFDENGCKGTRTVEWATTGHRVYMRSSYTCSVGLSGTSSTILALTPNGEWIETETVRAGQGSIEHVDHWRDAGIPRGLPTEVANALDTRRLAVTTARASAAAPPSVDEVLDAVQHVDSATVRSWIAASGRRFSLSGDEVATLVRANVPRGVLQAMVAWAPQPGSGSPGYDQDSYLKAASGGVTYAAGPSVVVIQPSQNQSYPMYCTAIACYPANQYSPYNGFASPDYMAPPFYPYAFVAPIIVNHRPFGPSVPRGMGPVGLHPIPPPSGRPPTRPVVHLPSSGHP
jgi:hypothetical protein